MVATVGEEGEHRSIKRCKASIPDVNLKRGKGCK